MFSGCVVNVVGFVLLDWCGMFRVGEDDDIDDM